jgi:hypothetical protein
MATITALPEYQQAHDDYVGKLAAAKSAGDALAEANTELEWMRKQNELRDTADERENSQKELEVALAEVKEKFPSVPEAMYLKLTDPADIRLVAEEAQKTIDAAVKSRTPTQRAGQWSAPAAGQATPAAKEKDKWEDADFIRDISKKVFRKDPDARDEVMNEVWERQVMPRFSKLHADQEEARQRAAR